MIWINVLLALLSVPVLIIGCIEASDGKLWGGLIAFVSAMVIAFNMALIIGRKQSEIPTALDVYRGKTTLEITYRDSVAIDSTVVYKVKSKIMAWVAVNEDGSEIIVNDNRYLERDEDLGEWTTYGYSDIVQLPYGSIEMLIGKEMTWEDEPVEI